VTPDVRSNRLLPELCAIGVAWLAAGCAPAPGVGIGEDCGAEVTCATGQCFLGVCTPHCVTHSECGGGYLCSSNGSCLPVTSALGDECQRELDCGPRQSCRLQDNSAPVAVLSASCQPELQGGVTGAVCSEDNQCRTGICSLGRCSEVCRVHTDCPGSSACVTVPRPLPDAVPTFRGCLAAAGRIEVSSVLHRSKQTVQVPVPSHARSFALVAEVSEPDVIVGATRIQDPSGNLLYDRPDGLAAASRGPFRYAPSPGISTLVVPNAPQIPLQVGTYEIEIGAMHPDGTLAAAVPRVTTVYKLGETEAGILDLNFYFLNLDDHPCQSSSSGVFSAAAASASAAFERRYLHEIERITAPAGITLGEVTFASIDDRPDLDALTAAELGALLSLSTTANGVNVFFVRSIHPAGVQALVGGNPGTPGIAGTRASGVAVSMATLCYRSLESLARITAHTIARQLGLYPNIDPDGLEDPIADSASGPENLLYFSEFGGTELSPGQAAVLRRNPVIR
jgi:hypothetical protein